MAPKDGRADVTLLGCGPWSLANIVPRTQSLSIEVHTGWTAAVGW